MLFHYTAHFRKKKVPAKCLKGHESGSQWSADPCNTEFKETLIFSSLQDIVKGPIPSQCAQAI